jgi:pentatricopeptide repeat protein
MIQLYVEQGDIDKANSIYNRMKEAFNEKVLSDYKEFIVILEAANKKQKERYKSFSGYAKKPTIDEKKDQEIQVLSKPYKFGWFTFLFGGLLSAVGAGTFYFLYLNKKRFNI